MISVYHPFDFYVDDIQTFYDLGCRMKMEDDWIRLLEPERWREVYARLKGLVRKGIIIRKHELNRKGFSIQRFQDMVATGALDYVQMLEYDFCMGKVAESLATCSYPTQRDSLIMPFMMFIDRASPHPEDCLRVLDFFLSRKVQRQLPERINLFPVDREELSSSSDGSVSFAQDYRCGLPMIVENSPLAECAMSTLNWDISRHIDKNLDDPFGKFEIKQSFLRGQGNFDYASAKY